MRRSPEELKMSTVRNEQHCAKWPGYEMTWVRNDPGTKWLEMKCVQVNVYVIIFKTSYIITRAEIVHSRTMVVLCRTNSVLMP